MLCCAPAAAVPPDPGEALAKTYCQTCHKFPEPSLLGKSAWVDGALKRMAPYLGMARVDLSKRPDGSILADARVFPDHPLLSAEAWQSIVRFYSNAAPVHVREQSRRRAPQGGLALFRPRPFIRSDDAPCTSLLQLDSANRRVFVGDAQSRTLKEFDHTGRLVRRLNVDSGPVSLVKLDGEFIVTLVGRILPSDETVGQVWSLQETSESWAFTKVLRGLRRPVHSTVMDLNRDGRGDLVVSCFGNQLGRLAAFERQPDGGFRELALAEFPGAARCLPHDWNADGLPDLTVLKAQGREGVDILFNLGNGSFRTEPVLEQPPSFGNASLELADFNRDGTPELIVVSGDNGDYHSEPKGYHGVRIYERSRDGKFVERFFFPVYGAYGARAADFDGDGDLDLAAISFFPDYDRAPGESFVYLRNEGNWDFHPFVIPESTQGRWLVMDAGDVDGDGDVDLLLGSFVRGPRTIPVPARLEREWETERSAVLLLENTTR